MEKKCNYGIDVCPCKVDWKMRFESLRNFCEEHVSKGDNEPSTRSFDFGEPIPIYELPPIVSYALASNEPVPAADYERLRRDFFTLRLYYEELLHVLEEKRIVKIIPNADSSPT